jgi:hypothetical protein
VGLVIALSIFAAPLIGKMVVPAVEGWYQPAGGIGSTGMMSLEFGTGYVPVIFLVLVGAAFLFLPSVLIKIKREFVRPVYLCGENIEYQTKWHGLADMTFDLAVGGFYFRNNLAEERMNIWAILLSGAVLVFSLAMGLLAFWPLAIGK